MKRLVLFDIDETLVKPQGVGGRALVRAFAEIVGRNVSIEGIKRSGRTDPEICLDILAANKIAQERFADIWQKLTEKYPQFLQEEISQCPDYSLHKGVMEIIAALEGQDGVFLGLLTGNTEAGARIKLAGFGINHHFPIGAFGCDSPNRLDLPAIAHKRAGKHFKQEIKSSEVVIIGDSENDILCAKGFGARSLVVNTGRTTWSQLQALNPDYLLASLEDTRQVLDAILA